MGALATFDSAFATHELIQSRADMVRAHPEHTHYFIDGTGKKPVGELNHARAAWTYPSCSSTAATTAS